MDIALSLICGAFIGITSITLAVVIEYYRR